MGYCIPCFGSSKHRRKSIRKTHVVVPSNQRLGTCESQQPPKATRQEVKKKIENLSQRQGIWETQQPIKATKQEVEKQIEPIVDSKSIDLSRNKHEEQSDGVLTIKKVTFDLNVKPHEEFPTNQIKNPSLELENEKENGNKKEATQNESQPQSDSSMSSVFTYPPSHRYHDCTRSDDDDEGESEAIKSIESDSDDNEESESLFSISLESRNQIEEKEVNSPIPVRCSPENGLKSNGLNQNERRKDLESVLNPIENLTQWRASKSAKTMQLKDQEKENINVNVEEVMAIIAFSEELHLKSSNRSKSQVDDVAVDTASLSSWLVESETTTSIPKNSPNDSVGNSPGMVKSSSRSCEGRKILGALIVEVLR